MGRDERKRSSSRHRSDSRDRRRHRRDDKEDEARSRKEDAKRSRQMLLQQEEKKKEERMASRSSAKFSSVDLSVLLGNAPPPMFTDPSAMLHSRGFDMPPLPPPPPLPQSDATGIVIPPLPLPTSFSPAGQPEQNDVRKDDRSVDSFVPMIPQSLALLPSSRLQGGAAMSTALTVGSVNPQTGLTADFQKMARESRRCHISGFPGWVTKDDLWEIFATAVLPQTRREMLNREVFEALGGQKELDESATVDVDRVDDLSVDSSKNKPYGFLQVNNADIVTELIRKHQDSPLIMHSPKGEYRIYFKRPKDFVAPSQIDNFKVVVQGFPRSMRSSSFQDRIQSEFEGKVEAFHMNENYAVIEFVDEEAAMGCVRFLNGFVVTRRLLIAQLMTEPMRGAVILDGLKIGAAKFSAIPGTQGSAASNALALVTAPNSAFSQGGRDLMREMLELTNSNITQILLGLKDKKDFGHLEPLYGTNVPIFPTRILILLNMFDESELDEDESYTALKGEIMSEVRKYGRVKELLVPRHAAPPAPPPIPTKRTFERKHPLPTKVVTVRPLHNPFEDDDTPHVASNHNGTDDSAVDEIVDEELLAFQREEEATKQRFEEEKEKFKKAQSEFLERCQHPVHGGIGKVFVEYETVEEAANAQAHLSKLMFGGRTVVTSFLFEDVLYPPKEEETRADANVQAQAEVEAKVVQPEQEAQEAAPPLADEADGDILADLD